MSLTSCYLYILELPVATLEQMLRAALAESEGAGALISRRWTNIPVNGYTATVEVRPADFGSTPPNVTLLPNDLELRLHLHMLLTVEIDQLPELDTIEYIIEFDLLGLFEKNASVTPPKLELGFPSVTPSSLNLSLSGGQISLTPELIEPRIHELYDANPTLGHDVQHNVPWPGEPTGVLVTTDIYDDEPGSAGFRGAITVTIPNPTPLIVQMPGHFKVQGLGTVYMDTDMTVNVSVDVQQSDGEIRIKLGSVQASDVTVTFVTSSMYDAVARPILAAAIADRLKTLGPPPAHDLVETLPTSDQIRNTIETQLIDFASALSIPIFTPQLPASSEVVDLTTFVPTTVNEQVLALQLVPRMDGTPCDTPDVFAKSDGFSVAIAAVEVERMLQPILDGAMGDREVEGYDVTVKSLSGTLSDPEEHGQTRGHIWIEGTTEVHVDCWPDPDVDFWGPIFLVPSMTGDGRITFQADAGEFGAEDPCCGDVDPAVIAGLIEGQQSAPIAMPNNFSGVGELRLTVTEAEVFRAGVVIHGSLEVLTMTSLHAANIRRTLYWFNEPAAGG